MFPLILLQAKAGGVTVWSLIGGHQSDVSINSPSGEGGGKLIIGTLAEVRVTKKFPLILLQAKAGGVYKFSVRGHLKVSINSPSGEGGGKLLLFS
jgi:hypothetical protein